MSVIDAIIARKLCGGGTPGADGKSAYQYAVEGGYTGTETEFAKKLATEIPTALKNPNALTIKVGDITVTYDGSAAKTVEIADGSEVAY